METAPMVTAAPGRPVVGAPSPFGLWYGGKSSATFSPTTDQLIHLYRLNNIKKMWLCCNTPQGGREILPYINANEETNIDVFLYIPTSDVREMAETPIPPVAEEWYKLITTNQRVIRYVCLGNAGQMTNTDSSIFGIVEDRIFNKINPRSSTKVSTIMDVNIILESYEPKKCPSECKFRATSTTILSEVCTRLVRTSTPLFVKTFPNCAFQANIDLANYLLEESAEPYMSNYKYVFDAMVDSISCAINTLGSSNVGISVVSGWPTVGSSVATIENALKYHKNLLRHFKKATPRGIIPIDYFIFSMVDEDRLTTNDGFDWGHFGTFTLWKKETFPSTENDAPAEAT